MTAPDLTQPQYDGIHRALGSTAESGEKSGKKSSKKELQDPPKPTPWLDMAKNLAREPHPRYSD